MSVMNPLPNNGLDFMHPTENLKPGEIDLGTSIMAVKIKDAVILGADSRTTSGSYIANRVTDKLTKVHDKIWCCRSGSAADTQAIADIVHYYLQMYTVQNNEAPTVKIAAGMFQEICYTNRGRLSAGLIVAGYDHRVGPEVYSITLGGSIVQEQYSISGSGSTYIYGFCDKFFKKDMTKEEGLAFVREALMEAKTWDGSSGGVTRLAVISKEGVERHFISGEEEDHRTYH